MGGEGRRFSGTLVYLGATRYTPGLLCFHPSLGCWLHEPFFPKTGLGENKIFIFFEHQLRVSPKKTLHCLHVTSIAQVGGNVGHL